VRCVTADSLALRRPLLPALATRHLPMPLDDLSRRALLRQLASYSVVGAATSVAVQSAAWAQSPHVAAHTLRPVRAADPRPAFLSLPSDGTVGRIGGGEFRFRVPASATGGAVSMAQGSLAPGFLGAPPHTHAHEDEILFVLEGTIHVMVDEIVTEVPAGAIHVRPLGRPHTFWNAGPTTARWMDCYAPGGHEEYLKEVTALFTAGAGAVRERLPAVGAKYGITYQMERLPAILAEYKLKL
jgi:mannose-6-phosphate isomerase-like protein (cupin superfamily)